MRFGAKTIGARYYSDQEFREPEFREKQNIQVGFLYWTAPFAAIFQAVKTPAYVSQTIFAIAMQSLFQSTELNSTC